jgi:hypothetical protein
MNAGTYNGKVPHNIVPLWLVQCSCTNTWCRYLARLKPDLLCVQGIPHQGNPPTTLDQRLTIQFIEFTYYNDRFSPETITAKTNKYQPLLDKLQALNWKVAPLIVLTTSARASTHVTTMTLLHDKLKIPKPSIKQTCIKINNIAMHHAMSILLHKRRIENNQPLPTPHDPP